MNIQSNKQYTIYQKEYNGKKYYKIGLSRKLQNGEYEKGYIDIQFKQDIKIQDKERIYLKNAFLTFYKNKDKATIPYIFVLDFEKVEDTIEHSKEKDITKQDNKDDFEDFGKEVRLDEVEITDEDLPF